MLKVHEKFEADLERFAALGGRVDVEMRCEDSEPVYAVDFQYLSMNHWAFDRVMKEPLATVHDFGSKADFVSLLAVMRPVVHYDIRRPDFSVPGLDFKRGDLLKLPINDGSVFTASCLHVAEHIGLGRYGDEIDPKGFERACGELSRVLSVGGSLFFAVPVGRPKVVFNAHRVLSVKQVLAAFRGLTLKEFSGIASTGKYAENVPLDSLDFDDYGCGLFHFKKEPVNV